MPPHNKRIFTLRDVSNEDGHNAENNPEFPVPPRAAKKRPAPSSFSKNNPLSTPYCQPAASSGNYSWTLHHIENLPNAELCRQTLERIQAEFGAIIQKRGYNVVSISEMCCCGDGLPKTRKVQPSNVWGYNLTTRRGGRWKRHEIHLRLRSPRNHALLLDYEDVAGTMAHELAHCVHGNHGTQFQALMNELLDEHASFMASQLSHSAIYGKGSTVSGSGGMTMAMPTTGGQTLGGTARKSRLLETATTGSKLGGTKKSSLSPREAALRAAETRRKIQDRVKQRAMEQSCLIDLTLEDDDDDDNEDDHKVKATKKSTRTKAGQRSTGMVVKPEQQVIEIDLDTDAVDHERKPKAKAKNTTRKITTATEVVDLSDVVSPDVHRNQKQQQWACTACTFLNAPTAIICNMCDKSRR